MIDAIQLKNFKNHRDTTIHLGRLTALVGPNGAGKTGILQAIHSMSQLPEQRLDDLQIVLTTHSPYIVDELEPSEVCVMALDSEGTVVTKRLDEHPDAKRALEVLTTGEFLSAEGEDWVLAEAEVYA